MTLLRGRFRAEGMVPLRNQKPRWALLTLAIGAVFSACSNGEEQPDLSALLLLGAHTGFATSSCPTGGWPFASGAYLADVVSEAPGASGSGFASPGRATDGVCGGGTATGSLDVYTLQSSLSSSLCAAGMKCLVLSWSAGKVQNVAGVDFVVYENPFVISADQNLIEPVVVEVSADGTVWCGFPRSYSGSDSANVSLQNPANYANLAGVTPVWFHQQTWTGSAGDLFTNVAGDVSYSLPHLKGGGDGFDLNGLVSGGACDAAVIADLQASGGGFKYVRLTSGGSMGMAITTNSLDQSPDIDGVVAKQVQ